MVLEPSLRGAVARIGVVGFRGSESGRDDEQTNRFGLTWEHVTAWWNGRIEGGRKLVQARNYSHWPLAYPRIAAESMLSAGNSVLFEIRCWWTVFSSPSTDLDVAGG
jgi:hypothetical protein